MQFSLPVEKKLVLTVETQTFHQINIRFLNIRLLFSTLSQVKFENSNLELYLHSIS